jgi:hypothetical protein
MAKNIRSKKPSGSFFMALGVRHKGICEPENKLKYESKGDAARVLQECKDQREYEIKTQGWSNRHETSFYECIFCKHWHLTSQEQQRRL